jgi:hypothetical protein
VGNNILRRRTAQAGDIRLTDVKGNVVKEVVG